MMEQQYESNFYIAAMQSITSLGAATIRDLVDNFGGPYEAWCALQTRKNLKSIMGIPSTKYKQIEKEATNERLQNLYKALQNCHIQYITYLDVLFPGRLQEIYNPPAVIFVRGNISLLEDETMKIAMVGARKCSDYGRNVALHLGKELATYNVAIVSGGARGIDSHSHEGTLAGKGQVIVVMGCGLDVVYPPENKRLFDRVLANNGLLLSEYPPGTPPSSVHFPARNRIISGLSSVIIVIEAKASSGSLITADMAANEGREIYVVPGSILSNVAEGNHWLIRQGANVLTKAQDLIDDYDLTPRVVDTQGSDMLSFNMEWKVVLNHIPTDHCISVADLIKYTHIPLQRLQSILLDLEMKRMIEKVHSKGYINIIGSDILVH